MRMGTNFAVIASIRAASMRQRLSACCCKQVKRACHASLIVAAQSFHRLHYGRTQKEWQVEAAAYVGRSVGRVRLGSLVRLALYSATELFGRSDDSLVVVGEECVRSSQNASEYDGLTITIDGFL